MGSSYMYKDGLGLFYGTYFLCFVCFSYPWPVCFVVSFHVSGVFSLASIELSVSDCLERLVSEMTCYVSSGT